MRYENSQKNRQAIRQILDRHILQSFFYRLNLFSSLNFFYLLLFYFVAFVKCPALLAVLSLAHCHLPPLSVSGHAAAASPPSPAHYFVAAFDWRNLHLSQKSVYGFVAFDFDLVVGHVREPVS